MKRLDAVMPGPINAIYGETIAGTAVIRAFGVQSVFVSGEFRVPTGTRENEVLMQGRAAEYSQHEDQRFGLAAISRSMAI